MRIAIDTFRGETPRLTPRALPGNGAQAAVNARLLSGDLEAWRQFALAKSLTAGATVQTIFLLHDRWLSWTDQVDVARGLIAGDDTFRTYLTCPDLYDQPRFTTYALATTGSEPYPVATRPLGVPSPDEAPALLVGVGSVPSIDITDAGDELSSSWTASGDEAVGTRIRTVSQNGSLGNAAPSYQLEARDNYPGNVAYMYRDFGVDSSSSVQMDCDFYATSSFGNTQAEWRVGCTSSGAGIKVQVGYPSSYSALYLQIGSSAGWSDVNSFIEQVPISALSSLTWYRMRITLTQNETGSTTVNARIYDSTVTTLLAEAEVTSVFSQGGYCGVSLTTTATDRTFVTNYDNIRVQGSGTTVATSSTATSYVYTYVDDFDQESTPSPVSGTVLRPDGVSVTVTTPAGLPSGVSSEYGVESKRIYRAVTGAAGSSYIFVAEIPLAQADYVDAYDDSEIAGNEVLSSEDWDLPPDDLEGIIALPNGIMAGFRRNQLCFSAQNRPHAWPVAYRLNTDSDIVGIANVDTTVVIGTKTFVYTASGSAPESYTMSRPGIAQACVSKRSMANLFGGVVFASPDGLMLVTGPTQVRNLTESIFTRRQWQALRPESILGVVHDDVYFLFFDPLYSASGAPAGYAIDASPDGFGVIELGFHASAAHADPLTDGLYLVLDDVDEPAAPYLSQSSTAPTPNGRTIYLFDGDDGESMAYRWRGKLHILPIPACFQMCQVQAEDYDNLVLRLYADGDLIFDRAVSSADEFRLPMSSTYSEFEVELIGTSRVRRLQVAEDVLEIE